MFKVIFDCFRGELCLSLMRSCWYLCGTEIQGGGYLAERRKWTRQSSRPHSASELGTWALGCPYG